MKVFKSYAHGISAATRRRKMVGLLWLVNLVFALPIYFLTQSVLSRIIGQSAAGADMVRALDFDYVLEWMAREGSSFRMLLITAALLAMIYSLVAILLYGGILHRLRMGGSEAGEAPRRFAAVFFEGAGRFFGRFFRLEIFSLILWAAFIIIHLLLGAVGGVLTRGGEEEPMLVPVVVARIAIGLILALFIKMGLDYARIKIVTEDSRKVLRAMFAGFGYVFRYLGKTVALFYLLLLTGVGAYAVLCFLRSLVPEHGTVTILIAFLIGQVAILVRGWGTVALQAGQLDFFTAED